MAVNTKAPFVYTLKHKMLGDQPSTSTTISNEGVTKLVAVSTYTLSAPYVGALKTIYRAGTLSTAPTLIAASSGVSFNSDGGAQVLVMRPTTTGTATDVSVTLIGESTAQWRIIAAAPSISFNATVAGIGVTT